MNANEIANELQDTHYESEKLTQVANFIRQQQAELDALKERNRFLESIYRTVKAKDK
jgi:hypothetical protein